MNFLSITKVRLDSKECALEKVLEPKDSENSADISSSTNEKIKGNYGKENDEKQKKLQTVIGEKIWRPSRKEQSGLKPLTISPVATNTKSESSSFPKLIAKAEKDNRKGNKTENGILTMKRSSSAPGCCYVQARVTKHKFRLPCIPDLRTLSITDDPPIKTHIKALVVEGKKLGSAGETGSTLDASDNGHNLPRSDIKVIIEDRSEVQAKKLSDERTDEEIDSEKECFHGDSCDDSFPAIKKTEFRVKSAYASSSRIFNTYLQSRFGKSVYESGAKKTATGAGKKYHVYWAPVLIKKQMLYNRTVDANGTQECRGERNSVEDHNRGKKRKVHIGGNIHGTSGDLCRQENECSSGVS